jgi:MSHA biogenesis protein MshJ
MNGMRRYWQIGRERFDKLRVREQVLVSIACVALLYIAIDALFIAPAAARQKRTLQETAQRRQESDALLTQITAIKLKQGQDPDAANRRRLEDMQSQLLQVQIAIREQSELLVAADEMSKVLERLLGRHPRLELVELKTIPRGVFELGNAGRQSGKPDAAGKSPTPAVPVKPGAEAPRGIYKHGIELSVRGGYMDLLRYVLDIEGLAEKIYWERLELTVTDFPSATLKLTVYTISFDSAWMTV